MRLGIVFVTNIILLMSPVYAPVSQKGEVHGESTVSNEPVAVQTTVEPIRTNEGLEDLTVYKSQRIVKYIQTGVYQGPSLEEKYTELAGEYLYPNVIPYLPVIDKVLTEKGLSSDANLVKVMFYVGQHESGWGQYRVSSFVVGSEHPTGIFQFLPSTFRSVSSGDIFNPEDQVRAFITMMERGRIDEYQVFFVCSYAPCLTQELKIYALEYQYSQSLIAGQSEYKEVPQQTAMDQIAQDAAEEAENSKDVAYNPIPVEEMMAE